MTTIVGTLNFAVVGAVRAGTSIVQSAICNRRGAVCHADLFHPSIEVRKDAHEAYFGLAKDPKKSPEWWLPDGAMSPLQYVNHRILDNPQQGEQAVGFRIHYPMIRQLELFELFDIRCREGDFCLVHVVRNPVACFVSLKQAERSNVWRVDVNDPPAPSPGRISIEPGELTEYVREHMAMRQRISQCCQDQQIVQYADLLYDVQNTLRGVFRYLELEDQDEPPFPSCRRLRNRDFLSRINHFEQLRQVVPSDVRAFFDEETLV